MLSVCFPSPLHILLFGSVLPSFPFEACSKPETTKQTRDRDQKAGRKAQLRVMQVQQARETLRVHLDDGSHVDRPATGIEIDIMPVDYLTKLVATAKGQDDIQRELKRRSKEATASVISHLARLLACLLACSCAGATDQTNSSCSLFGSVLPSFPGDASCDVDRFVVLPRSNGGVVVLRPPLQEWCSSAAAGDARRCCSSIAHAGATAMLARTSNR